MMAFTIMGVLDAAYYGVHIYSRVPSFRLYPFPDDTLSGGLGRLFRLPPMLLGSIQRFAIEKDVRDSCYLVG